MDGCIRELMKKYSLDCFVSFTADEHLNEYINDEDMIVRAITNFTGSNGMAITSAEPALITDGRYYIQARNESLYPLYIGTLIDYLIEKKYKRVSFDTRLIGSKRFQLYTKSFQENDIVFVEVDRVRFDGKILNVECSDRTTDDGDMFSRRINKEKGVIYLEETRLNDFIKDEEIITFLKGKGFESFDENVTGCSYKDKIKTVFEIAEKKTLIITELDTIAWIFNIRGFDIKYNPVFFAYCVFRNDEVFLFTDHEISLEGVTIKGYKYFENFLTSVTDEEVLISGDCNQFICSKLRKYELTDRIRDSQAIKNQIQLCGMLLAQIYDGIVLCNLFGWMDSTRNISEGDISRKLEEYKSMMPGYVGGSFPTISASGANSSIIHYDACSSEFDRDEIYLIDTGSHYCFGTTDTSRTMLLGENNLQISTIIHDYTLVLKDQVDAIIGLYDSLYSEIDDVARKNLRAEDKDFPHGTGHGVGQYLYVHEHPPGIYKNSKDCLKDGHVFSIEPGYYVNDCYGIRIENLAYARRIENQTSKKFELINITMVPYYLKLIDKKMLNENEKSFLNKIHKECYELFKNKVTPAGLTFLKENSKFIE